VEQRQLRLFGHLLDLLPLTIMPELCELV